ncbi:hypothetical protein [Hydrogenophaga sp.]|uniref:hypothetical protein n=1 Tax=Hydrogenophaga sp. TaxID=1904254 RepID=UPI00271DC273|nr:hypothetical protein [Hydrogenophaga sp.]MDO9439154.1 hypothetical protein [Hydrogenophaga sp.]
MRTHTPSPSTWRTLAVVCLAWPVGAQANDGLICQDASPPPGAIEVGATQPVIRDCPRFGDVDFTGRADGGKYFSGFYTGVLKDRSLYDTADDGVVIKRSGLLTTIKTNARPGQFPLLSGARPFYIEAQVATSSNHKDNFPAIWLMPIEHNLRMEDVYPGDPRGFERWFELDIDEGGFGPGGHHTAISWTGIWPNYRKIQNPNPTSKEPLDRTQPNVFGVSYSPHTLTVRWWLNGKQVLEAAHPFVPEIARQQNFYLILSAQSHKNISDYQMKFMGVRAFVGDESPHNLGPERSSNPSPNKGRQ